MSSKPEVDIDITIVIGSNESLVFDCLRSIEQAKIQPTYRIHVIANPATKETVTRLRTEFPSVNLIENPKRRGFAENHNLILRTSKAKYVFMLNDDTIVRASAIDQLYSFLEENPDVAIAGPRLYYRDGELQRSIQGAPDLPRAIFNLSGLRSLIPVRGRGAILGTIAHRLFVRRAGASQYVSHDTLQFVDGLAGAALLVRTSALPRAGLIDEVTYIYEEVEWQRRIRDAGFRIAFIPSAEIVHFHGVSTSRVTDRSLQMLTTNLNYFDKHEPRDARTLRQVLLPIFIVRRTVAMLRQDYEAASIWKQSIALLTNRNLFEGKNRYFALRSQPPA